MPPAWVDIRTPPPPRALGLIVGYADLVIEVAAAARAQRFYGDLLGFALDHASADGPRLRVGPGQHLVLAERPAPRPGARAPTTAPPARGGGTSPTPPTSPTARSRGRTRSASSPSRAAWCWASTWRPSTARSRRPINSSALRAWACASARAAWQ